MFFFWLLLSLFISLCVCGFYLKWKHKGNRLIHWASILILCGSLFALQIILEKNWLPYAEKQGLPDQMIYASTIVTSLLNVLIHTLPYYVVLVVFLIYSGIIQQQRWPLVIPSLPVWFELARADYLNNYSNSMLIALWGAIYLIVSIGLAARMIWREPDSKLKLNHAVIAVIFIVPIAVLNAYQFAPFPLSDQLVTLIPYVCVVSLLLISFLYMRDAFLGVKRKTVHTIHVGTGLIHHSLKNSISKVKLNALNIRRSLQLGNGEEAQVYIDNLLRVHQDMNDTMSNLSRVINTKVELQLEAVDLAALIDEQLEAIKAIPTITIEGQYHPKLMMLDKDLIAECLHNVFSNAIEAMNEKGTIRITLEEKNWRLKLIIKDTGIGMSNMQVQNIFEPFYSTKHRSGKNFGMGMFQVKKVMEAHKGKVEVKSKHKQGTSITLIFNKGMSLNE